MPKGSSSAEVLPVLAALKHGDDLARLVHTLAFAAADERRPTLIEGLAEAADRLGLTREDAETPFGNVFTALEATGAATTATRPLIAALLARGVALASPVGAVAEARVAEALLWLSTNTGVDALETLDAALDGKSDGLWTAVADLVRKADAGEAPLIGRAGAILGAAALHASASPVAKEAALSLAVSAKDSVIRTLLAAPPAATSEGGEGTVVQGQLVSPPRGPVALVLLGVTGILLAIQGARLLGRVALRYRTPAEVRVSAGGITVRSKTELLGRTLREREVRIPIGSLARASRDVRFARLPLYAGLFALALGSYLGISCFIDGARAGSPELLGIGALLVAAGVALDFVLENVRTGLKGRCQLILVPRTGKALAIAELDRDAADSALRQLAAI